ncbi:hypothetical protein GCM10011575_37270 [Microlunatus endophyticus]|uniref:ABC transporter domain-containing protein n=1 Tax=Microlunatus endophyticus TaxID=1716077 RepID=A0A917SFR2_9ACTN|nr:ABC transporter ATP-binding protein [Microlunatus endophyticus]GGL75640.1 hypothetical protein GCM10011575_37270 [Microlunatus endophyticus]
MSAALEIRGMSKTFVHRQTGRREQIFDGLDLTVEHGELVAVVGASGTGKTTLLHLIAGLESPDSGTIELGGPDRTPRLGMVFQQPRLFDWLPALQNVELATDAAGIGRPAARDALEAVGLAKYARSYPSVLSGGQRQRVGLARAFAIDPDVMLFDEPFSALDELTARRLRLLAQDLWLERPRVGLLVTHNPLEATFLADRIIVLSGSPARIVAEHRIDAPRPRQPEDDDLFALHRTIVGQLV